jgi:hypothetical protein
MLVEILWSIEIILSFRWQDLRRKAYLRSVSIVGSKIWIVFANFAKIAKKKKPIVLAT